MLNPCTSTPQPPRWRSRKLRDLNGCEKEEIRHEASHASHYFCRPAQARQSNVLYCRYSTAVSCSALSECPPTSHALPCHARKVQPTADHRVPHAFLRQCEVRLQEVVGGAAGNHRFAGSGAGVELEAGVSSQQMQQMGGGCGWGRGNVQGVLEVLVDLHDSGLVAASVAVVWRFTPQSAKTIPKSKEVNAPEKIVTTFRS